MNERPPETGEPRASPATGEPSDPSGADDIGESFAKFRDLGAELWHQLDLRIEKTRLGMRTGVFRVVLVLWLGLLVVVVTVLGLARIFSGASALIAGLTGWTWAPDLIVGALAIAKVAIAVFVLRWWLRRRGLRRLRMKYESRFEPPSRDSSEMEPGP